ncbi:hypothetical protein [Rhodoferax antarcticus]|uniref:hypothetical protein n=1 Tax=Rhodoferax antarcticus TaxID=81479 RepID=UPI00094FA025|nr:hypothetical protein [Rhodoferax antarcticus]APW47306.1 hypothetical protein RA876_14140 [Rhodoferax antarcticus]
MPASLDINTFEPLAWVNEYTRAAMPVDAAVFEPILQFSLMWNLFERDACGKEANPVTIGKTVLDAFAKGRLTLSSFEEHLTYFRDRSQREGMTIHRYLDALKMSNESARHLVHGVLSSSLADPNNAVHALLLIAHRIRNNLFHGEKEVASLHSQVELFRAVNSLLATYLSVTKSAA